MNMYELIGCSMSKNILVGYRIYKIDAGNLSWEDISRIQFLIFSLNNAAYIYYFPHIFPPL